MPGLDGAQKRVDAVVVAGAHVSVGLDERADGVGVVVLGGECERRFAVLVGEVGLGVVVKQHLDGVGLAGGGGGHEGGQAACVGGVVVHAGLQERVHQWSVAVTSGLDEVVGAELVAGLPDFLLGGLAPAASAANEGERQDQPQARGEKREGG